MLYLSDKQVARIFALTNEISAVQRELPAPPKAYVMQPTVQEEIARALRESVAQHRAALVELHGILGEMLDAERAFAGRHENDNDSSHS